MQELNSVVATPISDVAGSMINIRQVKVGREEKAVQVAPVQLDQKELTSPFETMEERFQDLQIKDIQTIALIPDYVIPTELKYPVVAQTPLGYWLLDGQNLVDIAKKEGKSEITCFVEVIPIHSVAELALRKSALRIKARGGVAHYSEIVRNTVCAKNILLATNADLKDFGHGTSRRGEGFTSDKRENIRKVLESRFGKSESAIEKLLAHARYLNPETLNFLADKRVTRTFFEKAQANKKWMVTMLTDKKMADDAITLNISSLMLSWCEEFLTTGKIKPVHTEVTVKSPEKGRNRVSAKDDALVAEVAETTSSGSNDNQAESPADLQQPSSIDEDVSRDFMSMTANPESQDSGEVDSLEAMQGDLKSQVMAPLQEAAIASDLDTFHKQLLAAVKCLPSLVQRAQRLNNG